MGAKMKTHKGILKRMRTTRKGKVVRHKAGRSHLLSNKSSKRKRRLRSRAEVKQRQAKTYSRLIGG